MPALLELQRAMRRSLFGGAPGEASARAADDAHEFASCCVGHGQLGVDAHPGLAIYRNTCRTTLGTALRLSFPAVHRLVGGAFFDAAADEFVCAHLPTSAYLNDYGADFPAFLAQFPPAAGLGYLADVARLEWAVNRALHASDASAIELARLAELGEAALPFVRFTPHPSISLLQLDTPADAIWRAVLDQNDAAMAALDPAAGPVWLLIERTDAGVQVRRLQQAAWRFTQRLCAGEPLHAALEDEPAESGQINAALADHLVSGRFIGFLLSGDRRA
jgi:hypothetical protein